MSGPMRWKDDEASPSEVRELLRSARGAGRSHAMPAASRVRSAARLDRLIALPAAAGLIVWLKGAALAAGLVVVGAVGAREVLAPSTDAPAPSASVATPAPRSATPVRPKAPASEAPSALASASPVEEAPSATVPSPPRAVPSSSPPSPALEPAPSVEVDPLAREAATLDRARALLDSNPRAALAILDGRSAELRGGHMGLERELLAVEALRRLGRFSEARTRGDALVERARGSIYEDRVRAILDGLPPG
jgi:hypothetical protein